MQRNRPPHNHPPTAAFKWLIMVVCFSLFGGSCREDMQQKDPKYNFIGDSIITRWPLDQTFPSQLVYNYGKSGSGITYLEPFAGRFNGEQVVVMMGTNDFPKFYQENIDTYVAHYLQTISALTDKTVYLFSVLPRQFKGDPVDVNIIIALFNDRVKKDISDYPNIKYIDVYDDFLDGDHINYQYYSDGLHLSTYGYEILTSKLIDTF